MIATNTETVATEGNWETIAKAKQAERLSKIPKGWIVPEALYKGQQNVTEIPTTCGILSKIDTHITSDFDATALLEQLRLGKFTSEEVVTAFCKRAAIAQQLVHSSSQDFEMP
jgi:amidase